MMDHTRATAILPPVLILPIRASSSRILLPTGVRNPCRGVEKKVHRKRPTEFSISSVTGPIPGRRDLTTGAQGPRTKLRVPSAAPLRRGFVPGRQPLRPSPCVAAPVRTVAVVGSTTPIARRFVLPRTRRSPRPT